jgi:DNA helicase HerA-like ATPase
MSNKGFGFVSTSSTSKHVNLIAFDKDFPDAVVGRLVYFDVQIGEEIYRSIGTVTTMLTENSLFSSGFEMASSRGLGAEVQSKDVRKSSIDIQAVFKMDEDGIWQQHGSALPTSPTTRSPVFLLTEETINDMLQGASYPSIGNFRGLNAVVPLNIPNYGGATGAKHIGVLGRSGSGKTAASAMLLGTFMSHENHAIIVIDPQGQWSNENGIPFSPQKLAKGLGRDVSVLRMGEDIRLPMDIEIFSRMMTKINLWSRFRKMGPESRDAFSREVAERIARLPYKEFNVEPRDLLSKIFKEIAYSQSAMARIYATAEKQESLRNELFMLSGEPIINNDGEQMILTAEDLEDIESNWTSILFAFKPLHSLFAGVNLDGGKRRPLSGDNGFLTGVFQVRGDNPTVPAPYVIIDMSPNVKLHAKAGLVKNDAHLAMQKVLDNDDIKALMLQMILAEMKKSSEVAFADSNGGNLNTQIVFDEAWRFAPEGKSTPEIEELAKMLEGFALDTRKFGIGWTYILQSPADLKYGIWKQLSYVLAGYGLVGEDVRRLEALTDDVTQIDLYRQFIAPASTKQYPFMFMGPISPLIFSTSPTFLNAFTSVQDFLDSNEKWISSIIKRRGLPKITSAYMKETLELQKPVKAKAEDEDKEFTIGSDKKTSEPQVVAKKAETKKPAANPDSDLPSTPF